MIKSTTYVGYLSLFVLIFYPIDQLMGDILEINNYEKYSPMRYILILYPFFSIYYFNNYRKIYTHKHITLLLAMVLWFYFSSIWAVNSIIFSIIYSTKNILLFSFVFSTVFILRNTVSLIPKILFYYAFLSGLLSLYIFVSIDLTSQGLVRLSFESIGVNALMISLGYSIIIGIGYLFYIDEPIIKKLIILFSIIIISLVVFQGGTRSVFWGIIFSVLLTYIYLLSKSTAKSKVVTVIVLFILFFSENFIMENKIFTEELLDRMLIINEENISDNSRITLWSDGIKWYSKNILGSGSGNEQFIYMSLGYGKRNEAHNTFISTLIQTNIIGLILLITMLVFLGVSVAKINKIQYKFLAVSLYIFFIIQLMKGSFLQTRLFWQPILIMLLMIEIDRFTSAIQITKKKLK